MLFVIQRFSLEEAIKVIALLIFFDLSYTEEGRFGSANPGLNCRFRNAVSFNFVLPSVFLSHHAFQTASFMPSIVWRKLPNRLMYKRVTFPSNNTILNQECFVYFYLNYL